MNPPKTVNERIRELVRDGRIIGESFLRDELSRTLQKNPKTPESKLYEIVDRHTFNPK